MTERIQINNLDELKSYSFKNGKELIITMKQNYSRYKTKFI